VAKGVREVLGVGLLDDFVVHHEGSESLDFGNSVVDFAEVVLEEVELFLDGNVGVVEGVRAGQQLSL